MNCDLCSKQALYMGWVFSVVTINEIFDWVTFSIPYFPFPSRRFMCMYVHVNVLVFVYERVYGCVCAVLSIWCSDLTKEIKWAYLYRRISIMIKKILNNLVILDHQQLYKRFHAARDWIFNLGIVSFGESLILCFNKFLRCNYLFFNLKRNVTKYLLVMQSDLLFLVMRFSIGLAARNII